MYQVSPHVLMTSAVLFIYVVEYNLCSDNYQDLNNEELLKQIKYENDANGNYYEPDIRYYMLVLKVNAAVNRKILMLLHHTRVYDRAGTSSELYRVVTTDSDIRLPSICDFAKAQSFIDTHPEAVQQIITERHNPFGDGSNYNSYQNILEATEKGLPNIFTSEYMEEPVRDMELHMRNIELEKEPNEAYYRLVLEVAEALKRKNIMRIPYSLQQGGKGVNTELYMVSVGRQEVLLPTVEHLTKARDYFMNKKRRLKELLERQRQNYLISQRDGTKQSGNRNEIVRTMVFEMLSVKLEYIPDDFYYNLVKKVDAAIKNNVLKEIEDSEYRWGGGVKTMVYNVVGENSKVALPSVSDLPDTIHATAPVMTSGRRPPADLGRATDQQLRRTRLIQGFQEDRFRSNFLTETPQVSKLELSGQKTRYQTKPPKKGGFVRRWFRRLFKGKQ